MPDFPTVDVARPENVRAILAHQAWEAELEQRFGDPRRQGELEAFWYRQEILKYNGQNDLARIERFEYLVSATEGVLFSMYGAGSLRVSRVPSSRPAVTLRYNPPVRLQPPVSIRGVAPSRVLATGASSHGEKLLEGGLDAAQSFDPMLTRLFRETNSGEFQGIWLNRRTPYTQFHDGDLAIYFRRNADVTGRVVGEEVQHAIDFTMGATRRQIAAESAARGIADADVVQWWHRRVFTRQLQNIHADQHGMGLLRNYSDDVYRAYQQQGGKLTLEEILTRKFNGLY